MSGANVDLCASSQAARAEPAAATSKAARDNSPICSADEAPVDFHVISTDHYIYFLLAGASTIPLHFTFNELSYSRMATICLRFGVRRFDQKECSKNGSQHIDRGQIHRANVLDTREDDCVTIWIKN